MAPEHDGRSADGPRPGLLTARAALVLLLAALCGAGCAVLLLAAGCSPPEALLGAAGAFGGAAKLFHELID